MLPSQPKENELLKTILEPLLEDFQYWFKNSRSLLETEQLTFLSEREKAELLDRIKKTQQEVRATQMLFKATDGKAGVDPRTLIPWHHLVVQSWEVSKRWREEKKSDRGNLGY
ncbi:MAG: DUF2605 domain-containing protein [Prochloraceae cyanobacterium]|nr:DUF2605 domain-containing protein [Prochloraceae cyanobacterium]